jgi:hypothetical protein
LKAAVASDLAAAAISASRAEAVIRYPDNRRKGRFS